MQGAFTEQFMAFDFIPKGDNEGIRDCRILQQSKYMSLEVMGLGKCIRQYLAMANLLL